MSKPLKRKERKKAFIGHFDYDEFFVYLQKRINKLRREKGFTSYENFAYDIEISRSSMAKYDSGTFDDIRLRTLLKIIDGLEMTPTEFFMEGFERLKYKTDPKD